MAIKASRGLTELAGVENMVVKAIEYDADFARILLTGKKGEAKMVYIEKDQQGNIRVTHT